MYNVCILGNSDNSSFVLVLFHHLASGVTGDWIAPIIDDTQKMLQEFSNYVSEIIPVEFSLRILFDNTKEEQYHVHVSYLLFSLKFSIVILF